MGGWVFINNLLWEKRGLTQRRYDAGMYSWVCRVSLVYLVELYGSDYNQTTDIRVIRGHKASFSEDHSRIDQKIDHKSD